MNGIACVVVGILCLAAMVTHIWVTVAANWAALLIIGLVFPPIGVIHGFGVWLGLW